MNADINDYISLHIDKEPDYLTRIDRLSNMRLINGRMCSGHIQGRFLKMLVEMINPQKVVELGTFSGYSALCIAEGMKQDGIIHTFEIDDELQDFITRNLNDSPYANKIILHIGEASETIKSWEPESFDLAFIDADKREYPRYYDMIFPIIRKGGYIIADNTLWDDHVIDINTPPSSQTKGIMDFNNIIAKDNRVEKVIIPIRDGITIIRKK